MNKKGLSLTVVIVLVLVGAGFYFSKEQYKEPALSQISTTTPIVTYVPYGKVAIKVGETVKFKDNSITLLRVVDESRCATGVTCVWAGTVKVEIISVTGMGTSTEKIELGKFLTTGGEKIEVISVTPYPTKDTIISQNMYQVTFEVSKKSDVVVNPNQGACYIGGCSAQMCSDTPDMVSTCEYKEEYACYQKTSTCTRQSNGECGWTQTNELKACLASAIQGRTN